MNTEPHLWLAAVIAAHPEHRVYGRTRLQKTVKLLQRLGLPVDYNYVTHFYGPYSEGVHSDIGLLEQIGMVRESARQGQSGAPYYVVQADPGAAELPDIEEFRPRLQQLIDADAVVLELAATYDAFREMGYAHPQSLELLRQKKGQKCADSREEQALKLLDQLGLPTN